MNEPLELYDRVRELVKDPKHTGKFEYGALGAIKPTYRDMIWRLCDYAETMDKLIVTAFEKLGAEKFFYLFETKEPLKKDLIVIDRERYFKVANEAMKYNHLRLELARLGRGGSIKR